MSGQCYNGDGTGHDDQPRTTLRDALARSSSPKPGPSFDPDNAKYSRHLFDCCHDGCGLDERATYTPVEHLGGGRFGFECQRGHRWTVLVQRRVGRERPVCRLSVPRLPAGVRRTACPLWEAAVFSRVFGHRRPAGGRRAPVAVVPGHCRLRAPACSSSSGPPTHGFRCSLSGSLKPWCRSCKVEPASPTTCCGRWRGSVHRMRAAARP